ncbi:MAG TPA: DUF2207 domain-containing protein [Anditalea sp.]|nr:DUF2207 domain-containing protein [Anditalea sp.]
MLYRKLVFILIFTTCFIFGASAKKSYKIEQVNIVAEIHPDGSMTVQETRAYNFNGKFTYAFRQFPHQEGIIITDYSVKSNGKFLPLSDKEELGHFVILDKKNYTEVGWSFEAKDEVREFTVTYTLENIIQRYEDAAVLYYKFIDKQWKVNQENVNITIRYTGQYEELPASRHWLHGPAHAYSEIGSDGEILIESHTVSKNDFLEIRALYPEHWFPEVFQVDDEVVEDIMSEEKQWADEANERRLAAIASDERFEQIYEWAPIAIFSLYALMLALVIWIYKSYRREEVADRTSSMEVKPPSELHPALINYLIHGYHLGYELNATLYLLAQKRIISIEDRNPEGKNSQKELYWLFDRDIYESKLEGLLPFEVVVIEYLFGKEKEKVSFSDIAKSPTAFQKMLGEFNKQVIKEGRRLGIWFQDSIKGMKIMVGLTSVVFVLFFVSIVFFKIWSLFVLLLFVVMVVLTIRIRQRNTKYQEEYYRWISYRKYLKSVLGRKSNREVNYELVNEHLVYGTVFGLTKNQITRLLQSVPHASYHHYLYWYIILYGNRVDPNTMSTTISQMAGNLANTPISSAGGTGGGASFGGGGGFSAGGGGAR